MSEQDDRKQSKYYTPAGDEGRLMQPRRVQVASVTVVTEPDTISLMRDALGVVADEVMRFKKNSSSRALTLAESRVLQGYIKCLVELQKEKRESDDTMDLANLSNDELLKLVEKLKGVKSE